MNSSSGQFERQLRFLHALAAAAVCLLMLTVSGPRSTSAQTESDPALLDGRIGGSVTAFEEKYGETTNDPAITFDAERAYDNKNYRNLIALAVDDTIYSVAFSADVETTPEDERATWSVGKATSLAKRFLPDDAKCGKPGALPGGEQLRAQCTSEALSESWDSADYEDASRAGAVGALSFTLSLAPDDTNRVTAIAAAVGTKSLEEAGLERTYLTQVNVTNEFVPGILDFLGAVINGEPIDELTLVVTVTVWIELYTSSLEIEPPAEHLALHQQFLGVLNEIELAQSNITRALTFDDEAAGQLGIGHYYAAVGLYEAFKPALEQALVDAGLA